MLLISLLVALSLNQAPAADQGGRVSGRVTLAGTMTPVSGARILLIPATRPVSPMGPPPQATTDQDGRFDVAPVAPGAYRLDVQKSGLAPLDSSRAPTVTLAAGQSIDGVNLQMQKGAVIAGRILDPAGEPLPDARIMVFRRPPATATGIQGGLRLVPAPNPGTQTNDLGEFRLASLAPGEYFVAAMPRPLMVFGAAGSSPARDRRMVRSTLPTTYYPGTTDQQAAQPIAVAAGAEVANISFTMQQVPAFRVSGIVIDEADRPVAGAMVMLVGDPRNGPFTGPVGNAMSQADGRFDVDGVPAGSYRAQASIMMRMTGSGGGGIGGSVSWSSSSDGRGAIPQSIEVVVADTDVTGVRVVAQRPNPR